MGNAGDKVQIETEKGIKEGTIIQRPPILRKGYLVLKLENGYNIGIDEKKIKKITVLKKREEKTKKKKEIKFKEGLPTISIISLGGTISSRIDYTTGGVAADYTAKDFIEMCPELEQIANIRAEKLMSVMSEDMGFKDWQKIARKVAEELNKGVDGVVLTQGTDFLHYTSSVLSFFLRDLNKPVVVTGAQRSIDRGSSDAFMNLISAVIAAKSDIAEVMTCMHGTTSDDYCLLCRGVNVRKMHTSKRDAFKPINEPAIAKVYPHGDIKIQGECEKRCKGKVKVEDHYEDKTGLVFVHPGFDPTIIEHYIDAGYKGLVIGAGALGHVPTNNKKEIVSKLKKAVDQGIVIVISAQTYYGRVHPYVYANLRKLSIETGCTYVEDCHPETAYVKLAWLLGKYDCDEVKEKMKENFRGEITRRSSPHAFYE